MDACVCMPGYMLCMYRVWVFIFVSLVPRLGSIRNPWGWQPLKYGVTLLD